MDTRSNHRKLVAWQEAMSLVLTVYRDTARFPTDETYGLRAQMRRAAVSVPSNIAEGAARNPSRELGQFLSIACGSIAELETQVEIAARLGYLQTHLRLAEQIDRVGMLVRGLRKSVVSKANASSSRR
jgi:four helix bundle protein